MKRTKEYEDARKQLIRDAVDIANKKIRVLKLPELLQNALTSWTSSYLFHYWNPYEVDYEFDSGFGMRLNLTDPIVRKIMAEEQLYDVAVDIVQASIQEVMMKKDVAPFLEAILNEIIIEGRHFD